MSKKGYVYILSNSSNTVLYTGVTSDLWARVGEHKQKLVKGFTKRYNVTKLVWFEEFGSIHEAIASEKKIKAGSRAKKIKLIKTLNPEFRDLAL
ncbi:MAG TPA: GIY-YIG nuclease family protein [Candidatus Omnitrophota bacterium]|nr:GIY-YIG nuclease family protein [Candidatus Omnitrophota bacterium]